MLYHTTSVLSGINHGFWSRNGGVSEGYFSSMNLAVTKGDAIENVARNREIISKSIKAELLTINQVHGAQVKIVDRPWEFTSPAPQADAMICQIPGIAIGILTADCVPVLIYDDVNKTVGAIHAGWRSALGDIVGNTVRQMQLMGSQPSNLKCAIGACIQQDNYEVSSQLYADFTSVDPAYEKFFLSRGDKYMLDLPDMVESQLRALGVKEIENTKICTYANPDQYHSCRRATHQNEPTFGCQVSFIGL